MKRHIGRPLVALVAVATVGSVAACGSGSPAAGGAAPTSVKLPTTVASASVANAPAAQRALDDAIVATSALRSYGFRALQTVGRASSTTLAGRAIRPSAVTYVLSTRSKQLQIVRLAKATYLRQIPGTWSRLAHPGAAVDPAASLLALLRNIGRATASRSADGSSVVHGVIPAGRGSAAGLPAGSGAAIVTVTLDAHYRVTAVVIRAAVSRAGSAPVTYGLSTMYSAFNAVPAVTSPV